MPQILKKGRFRVESAFFLFYFNISERITYGEVESESVPELRDVVVARLACVVRGVDAYAEVEAKNEELEVVAQSETCTERQLVEEVAKFKLSAWMGVIASE